MEIKVTKSIPVQSFYEESEAYCEDCGKELTEWKYTEERAECNLHYKCQCSCGKTHYSDRRMPSKTIVHKYIQAKE